MNNDTPYFNPFLPTRDRRIDQLFTLVIILMLLLLTSLCGNVGAMVYTAQSQARLRALPTTMICFDKAGDVVRDSTTDAEYFGIVKECTRVRYILPD